MTVRQTKPGSELQAADLSLLASIQGLVGVVCLYQRGDSVTPALCQQQMHQSLQGQHQASGLRLRPENISYRLCQTG